MNSLTLLPAPQQMELLDGVHGLGRNCMLTVCGCLLAPVRQWVDTIAELAPLNGMGNEGSVPNGSIVLDMAIDPLAGAKRESYELLITPDRIEIRAVDELGLHAATMTLRQVFRQCASSGEVPCLQVRDWPNFSHRGVMLDISRNRVPTLETLFSLVEQLSEWKINQLQLYTEHTFAYRDHPDVWRDASPMSAEEIRLLDAFCRARCIELVPNQNSLGHMRNWLTIPGYEHLAEIRGEYETVFGHQDKPWGLCATDPATLTFLGGLYDDLLPHFTSSLLNVGCDEAVDLGKGRSKALCEERGEGPVYVEFIRQIHRLAATRGKRIQLWADMMNQYQSLIPQLPTDVIALEWGYEGDWDFASHLRPYRQAGIDCYVCPGTSSWCALLGRGHNARLNLQCAAEQGLAEGAEGYLIADWGDHGHWQHLAVSLFGFAFGAAAAWSIGPDNDSDLAHALDLHVFHDRAGIMGQAVLDLSNLYLEFEVPFNSTTFFHALYHWNSVGTADGESWQNVSAEVWEHVLDQTNEVRDRLKGVQTDRMDALNEVLNMVELTRHACMLAHARAQVAPGAPVSKLTPAVRHALAGHLAMVQNQFERLWNARSKTGWLSKSLAPLQALQEAYAETQTDDAAKKSSSDKLSRQTLSA